MLKTKNFKTTGLPKMTSTVKSMQMSCLTGLTYRCFLSSNIFISTAPLTVRVLHHK